MAVRPVTDLALAAEAQAILPARPDLVAEVWEMAAIGWPPAELAIACGPLVTCGPWARSGLWPDWPPHIEPFRPTQGALW